MTSLPAITVEMRPGAGPLFEPAEGWLDRPALSGANASTPDHASLDITGDIDIRAEITPSQWSSPPGGLTIVAKYNAGVSYSWRFMLNGSGPLYFDHSADGTSVATGAFSNNLPYPPASGRLAVRVTLDVDNGAGGRTYTFYTAPSIAGPWTQLGTPVTIAGTTSIFASTAPVTLGTSATAITPGRPMLVHAVEIRDGIAGTVVTDPDFSGHPNGTTSFADSTGKTWTANGAATIVGSDDIPWVDISDRFIEATITTGRTSPHSPHPSGEATLVLENHDRALDPEHTGGTWYGQLLPRVPFRIRAVHEATTYDLFYGFVDGGWVQDYEPEPFATCRVDLVDLLGVLAGRTLDGVYKAAVKLTDPAGFWALDEDRGESVADLGYGRNDGTVVGGVRLGDDPVAPGTAGSASFDGVNGSITVTRSPIVADVAESAIAAVFTTQVPSEPGSDHPLFVQLDGNTFAYSQQLRLYIGQNGTVEWSYLLPGLVGDSGEDASVYAADGKRHIAFGIATGYVGNRGVAVDRAAGLVIVGGNATEEVSNGVAIGGTPFASHPQYTDNQYEGRIGPVAVWERPLTLAERDRLIDALDALDGQRSDQHIAWALDQLGVPAALRNLDVGRSIMGPAATEGVEALDYIRQIVATEQGAFFVDHRDGGKLRFVERFNAWLNPRATTVQAEFTDAPTLPAGAHRYRADIRPDPNGIDSIVNVAEVAWVGGTVRSADDASVDAYGPQRRTIRTVAAAATVAQSIGQWVVLNGADPKPRVSRLPVNPGGDYSLFPAVLTLREFDRIGLTRHPQQIGTAIVDDLLIEGATHHLTNSSEWRAAFALSSAAAVDLFTLGTSLLDSTHVLGY